MLSSQTSKHSLLRLVPLMVAVVAISVVQPCPQRSSAQETPVQITLPAQSLGQALTALARQTGIELLAPTELVAGKQAPAISGTFTPQAALEQLLQGSGLEARSTGERSFVVQRLPPVSAPRSQAQQDTPITMPPVVVEEQRARLPPPYAGGQVARGGQLGILGNRDIMDTPFNQTNYTAELMENQQVRHVADVLRNDPTAHANASTSTGADDFNIRGFYVGNTDLLFNGLAGVAPSFFNSAMAESIERVEVLKGPNAMLNGVAPNGSVGGAINLIPKRAGDLPLTQFTLGYSTDTQIGGHIDFGRRVGQHNEFGVRFNGVYRNGDTAIDDQSRASLLAAFGFDYRVERLRLSADLGYQKQNLQGITDFTSVVAGFSVPKAPDNNGNYDGPDDFSKPEVFYGTLRGEFDLNTHLTAFAAFGGSLRRTRYNLTNRTIIDTQGNLEAGESNLSADKMSAWTLETGLQGRVATGPVKHQMVLAYTLLDREWRRVNGPLFTFPASNIYNPVFGPGPDKSLQPSPGDAKKFQDLTLSGTALADTLSILDERVQLTLGARYQRIDSTFFNITTGAVSSDYNEAKITPMVGLVVKPWQRLSLYANYIQGLQEGPIAPLTAANAGEGFAPFVTKQYEVGAKVDFGRFSSTLALYQIAQPSGFIDPATNIFGVDGEQRHRGVDFNIFGEVVDGVRLLGGVAYINSKLTKTEGGVNEGNTGPGVPKWRLVIGGEWDTPFVPGLTVSSRVIYNSSMFIDPANTQSIPGWTRLDIGARYRLHKAVTVRANLDNVLDKSYWDANPFGQLTVSEPRTFSLSATFDF